MASDLLKDIRVIDLATTLGEYCGRVLADLGAEVIVVEPPEGHPSRGLPPFDGDRRDADASLYWACTALGKRSVVLDLETGESRDAVRQLAQAADVLVESFAPGHLASLGLGYEALMKANPGLVYASISPFGQDGPEADAAWFDTTLECAGGLVGMQGDGDRPNLPIGFPQARFHAGAQAAADVCIALLEREHSGLGQHLDVSAQAAVVWTLMNATGYPKNTGGNPPGYCDRRAGPAPTLFPGLEVPRIYACRDGWATLAISLGGLGARTLTAAMRWLESEDACPADLRGLDWMAWSADVLAGKLTVDQVNRALQAIARFFEGKTKLEIQAFAAGHRALISPVYDVRDLATDPHLAARGYWTQVGGRTHSGPFAKLSGTPMTLPDPAPLLGQHQALLGTPAPARPARAVPGGDRPRTFAGLKVADFAWVGVGPIISKALADHGATVVHIESSARPDVLRGAPPFKDNTPGLDNAQFMANFNSSKLGLACDLTTPEGRELAWKLIEWADVIVESFTPGTLATWGFDYEQIRKRRPDIVMLSTCLRGQTGPERKYTGFGGQGAALAGLFSITGWPDRAPVGPWGAYTDFINPRFGVAALASAIRHRELTGIGQHIDLAQTEAGIRFLEPLVLDYTVNGRLAEAPGLESRYASPHGVYRCQGTERYLCVAIETDVQWQALVKASAIISLDRPEYATGPGRRANAEAIDMALASWCAGQDAFELGRRLRHAGVPAYAVLWPSDLYDDAQLEHRGFFVTLDHTVMGPTPYDGLATKFSATPGLLAKAAPCLGEDTDMILRDILNLDDDTILRYAEAGALS